MSLECPRRLYYAYDSEHYANQDVNDEFLKSLAEGGFQVGEFAKLCYGIEVDNMVATLVADDAIARTDELLKQDNVNIAEAAFRVGNMFVRADIIEKKGDVINLIEVKAKSWNPLEESFEAKNGKSTNKSIRPYLYDVAFQKYVIVQALKEIFPPVLAARTSVGTSGITMQVRIWGNRRFARFIAMAMPKRTS